ncbi:MAG TPA: hypothetical protein DEP84_02925 [Chloroflexi bacterium]|nr:hypothetical protein [Chloroflexota bacterium]
MATDVVMPLLGLTMEKGTLVSWLKQEGDPIHKGEVLFEVETDKATQEVESQVTGFLAKILVEPGTTLPIGAMIAIIAESEAELRAIQQGSISVQEAVGSGPARVELEERAPYQGEPTAPQAADQPTEAPTPVRGRVPVSPAARRIAEEYNIALETITGSGPGGRIMQADVLQAIKARERVAADQSEYVELTPIRRLTAQRMAQSFQTVPHFYLSSELDAAALVTFRRERLASIEAESGVRLSFTDLLITCLALSLKNHPLLYATWEEEKIKLNRAINISLATETDQGLTVPVIHDADRLSLVEITRRRSELIEKAQAGGLSLADLSDGTFTLTNLGMFDVDVPQAIINPPQAAILATGAIKERVVAREGGIYVRPTMHVTLSVDHRIADGVTAARFLQDFQHLIANLDRLRAEVG